LSPDEFIAYLDELSAAGASREDTVRGYKVKVPAKPTDKVSCLEGGNKEEGEPSAIKICPSML